MPLIALDIVEPIDKTKIPKITAAQKKILKMFLNNKKFKFNELIDETMIIAKPEDLSSEALQVDMEPYSIFFESDALKLVKNLIETKQNMQSIINSRPKRIAKSTKKQDF